MCSTKPFVVLAHSIIFDAICSHVFPSFRLSLYTSLMPTPLTNMCLLGLRNSAFPVLAGPLTFRFASKANMTGSGQGGLLQFHQWEEGGGCKPNRPHENKLTWVWSKCHPHSFHSSLHPYLFQMTCAVVFVLSAGEPRQFFFFFFFTAKYDLKDRSYRSPNSKQFSNMPLSNCWVEFFFFFLNQLTCPCNCNMKLDVPAETILAL